LASIKETVFINQRYPMIKESTWIDSHHHLWHLEKINYPWLMAKGEIRFFGQADPIRKNYLLPDYQADHKSNIVKSVHIQVGAVAYDALKETQWINDCHSESKGHFPCKAVVAIDMLASDVESQIINHNKYPVTQGVRHIIGKHHQENKKLPKFIPSKWLKSLSLLSKHKLSFDLQMTEEQYSAVFDVLKQLPDLKVTICHLASPWDQSHDGFNRWKKMMKEFSKLPNCSMKISGFSMFNHGMIVDKFNQYAQEAIEIFGPTRCMFGSNFPVDKLYISYDELLMIWQELLKQYSDDEAQHLRQFSAAKFYQIEA
jgi:predicted TIM-barrel fold metal-dependent hydrolase